SAPADIHEDTMIIGGSWIAYAGFVYVVAWLVGLAIGLITSAPGSTDSNSTLGVYFSTHREVAMIQAYLLDGIAGISLIVLAAAHRIFLTHALPRWLVLFAIVLAPLLVVAGWNFVLSSSLQIAAYAVLLLVLLVCVAAVIVVCLRRVG